METPKINWNKDESLAAAEKAVSLSALLEQEGFYEQEGLQWLTHDHVAKFLDVVDAEEAKNLRKFAEGWYYKSDRSATGGFPLLDHLWALDPQDHRKKTYLGKSSTSSDGWRLVARLAILEPAWVARWWKWQTNRGSPDGDSLHTKVFVSTLTTEEFRNHASELTDEVVAEIIMRRPDLLDCVLPKRIGAILSLAVEPRKLRPDLADALYSCGLLTNATAIIDSILDNGEKSDPLDLLDDFTKGWKCPSSSNPVTQAMINGHERLDSVLRSPWQACGQPSEKNVDSFWTDKIGRVHPIFAAAAGAVPNRFKLELGFSVGIRIADSGLEPSTADTREQLRNLGIEPSDALMNAVFPMTELWATLSTLAKYEKHSWEHKTQLVGLRAKVASLASTSPSLWAQALPWILVRASALGNTAQAVTLELASTTQEVLGALESARNDKAETVRLIACGMQALLYGLENPQSGLARTLADAAAHYIDGTPIFPHPLALVSATWLGAAGVERAIANGVRRATDRFASEVRDQGGDTEPALTKALVKEIEVEFRGIQPRLNLMGTSASRLPVPILSVRQRPSSPQTEEPIYGCDLAWLLNATVRGRYSATWVDLIQVKKSKTLQHNGRTRPRADSWTIDCKQLNNILKWSATAAYWLIASAGEVLVIPARHLEGIRCGTEKHVNSKSFTVGYHEVRSAAIPLEQYLVDLLIGQWVGTSSEEVVQFVLGENSTIRPRLIVEVTISVGQENHCKQ